MRLTLAPHPETPCEVVRVIAVEATRAGTGLSLIYEVAGDLTQVKLADPGPPGRADGLWKHSCLEAFVRAGEGYREINLSPSRKWAVYAFDGYRAGMRNDEAAELSVLADQRAPDRYRLTATLGFADLPGDSDWSVGLSAVIELADGRRCYWAINHPPGKPDFHHPDAFTLTLPAETP
ncbi:MAG TPA: DOMON-like domain-containing protein [Caulobacter sp.]|nr:DOMON-like domain-containing protein [Caulobacter sp.]